MGIQFNAFCAILSLGVAFSSAGSAQPAKQQIALKSGETADVANLFWVANCKSLLTGPIAVEVLEGPPGVTAAVKEQKVIPHKFNCAKEVPGGHLIISAPAEVKAKTEGTLTVRMKYPTKDGERQASHSYNVVLYP
jgi:hypothetical protein